MRKRIIKLICIAVACVTLLCPLCAGAAPLLDTKAEAELTVIYQKDGNVFPDLKIQIFRVAEAYPDGTFELTEPYNGYPINIHDITAQEQWTNIATTLCSYIVAEGVEPYREEITDETGVSRFTGLETGLYLVREVTAENNSGTYVFNRFMVYLPTPTEDGSYDYSVEAVPKCLSSVPKTEYRVTKLWQDSGYATDRPEEITVDIYKDGQLWESQVLNGENNWSYVWYVSEDDNGIWTVAERDVNEFYTVSIQQNGGSFTIINNHAGDPGNPDLPLTGDTFSPLLWVMIMCFSGVMLIVIGVYGRRRA